MANHAATKGLALTATLALLVAGCGDDSRPAVSNDEAQIRDTVTSLYSAVARGDGIKACRLMSAAGKARELSDAARPSQQVLSGRRTLPKTCEQMIKWQGEDLEAAGTAPEVAAARVRSVDVLDDQATVSVDLGRRQVALVLRRHEGRWLVDGAPN